MTPVLYSFRRCPYAVRARMALHYAGCQVDIHEVSLKAKPLEMLERSPKGTVPVLILEDRVLEQSLDIMHWALAQNDPDDWLLAQAPAGQRQIADLIEENDQVFKLNLDRYKYAVRHPEHHPSITERWAKSFCASWKIDCNRRLICWVNARHWLTSPSRRSFASSALSIRTGLRKVPTLPCATGCSAFWTPICLKRTCANRPIAHDCLFPAQKNPRYG